MTCFVPWLCAHILCSVSFVEFVSGDSRNPLHGEGGNIELGARASKHILVFATNRAIEVPQLLV